MVREDREDRDVKQYNRYSVPSDAASWLNFANVVLVQYKWLVGVQGSTFDNVCCLTGTMALMSLAVKVVAEAVAEEAVGDVEVVVVAVSVQLHAMRSHRMVKLWM